MRFVWKVVKAVAWLAATTGPDMRNAGPAIIKLIQKGFENRRENETL